MLPLNKLNQLKGVKNMPLFEKLVKAFKDAKKAVTDFTMKGANSIIEGLTAGYWQGKDVYNGFGANPAPTENNMFDDAKSKLNEDGNGSEKEPDVPKSGTSAEGSSGTSSGIEDKTDENIEIPMYYGENDVFNWIEHQQQVQFQREDALRKEVQAREDSAIQRQVEDAIRAGVNPNLINITGAESGGGITNATGKDYTVYEKEMDQYLKELEMLFDKNFQGNEKDKDRTIEVITSIMTMFGLMARGGKK